MDRTHGPHLRTFSKEKVQMIWEQIYTGAIERGCPDPFARLLADSFTQVLPLRLNGSAARKA